MRAELLEPGGCSAWPTSAWAAATIRAAGVLPAGAAAGATEPAEPTAPVAVVAGEPVTAALRSIDAKSSVEVAGVAVVVVAVAVEAGAAVGPASSEFSWAMREATDSRLIFTPSIGGWAETFTPAYADNR